MRSDEGDGLFAEAYFDLFLSELAIAFYIAGLHFIGN